MAKFKVYHNQKFLDVPSFYWGTKAFPEQEDLKLVAIVNCENLEEVFHLTNHIDVEWWENEEVELVKKSRSTSCGDVVENSEGEQYLCASVGWKKLN